MRIHRPLFIALVLASCKGDESPTPAADGESTESGTTTDPGTTGEAGSDASEASTGSTEGGSESESETGSANGPTLPEVLSLVGCDTLGLGPLCSVVPTGGGGFSANCSGIAYEGTLTEDGDVTLKAATQTDSEGATIDMACTGTFERGRVVATCTQSISAAGDTPASETTCELESDPLVLPSVTCLELPATLEDVVICSEGEGLGGTTLEGGSCRVIQDGCVFQAECADDLTLTGTVSRTGITFRQVLAALADAQTPENGEPAFLQGEDASHNCTGTFDGTSITGTCVAGRVGRNGTDTSVCSNAGSFQPVPTCDPVTPEGTPEHLFVLDPCEILEVGEGGQPGIGTPLCAFRQNNCIWEVQCGNDPNQSFTNRLEQDSRTIEWRLATGTPCEATFDETSGELTGMCTVPGQAPCQLTNLEAVPGGDDCTVLPVETPFSSRGCGGPSTDCSAALQHGCEFIATCTFGANEFVVAGQASLDGERPHLEFNGIGDYACYVDQATEEEIASGDRLANEWYGDCTNSTGGTCRDNFDPSTGEGFRGLQLFFEE